MQIKTTINTKFRFSNNNTKKILFYRLNFKFDLNTKKNGNNRINFLKM